MDKTNSENESRLNVSGSQIKSSFLKNYPVIVVEASVPSNKTTHFWTIRGSTTSSSSMTFRNLFWGVQELAKRDKCSEWFRGGNRRPVAPWYEEILDQGFNNCLTYQLYIDGRDRGKIENNSLRVGRRERASWIGCAGGRETGKWQGIYRIPGLNHEFGIGCRARKDSYQSPSRDLQNVLLGWILGRNWKWNQMCEWRSFRIDT
jgi:hypothetical protein